MTNRGPETSEAVKFRIDQCKMGETIGVKAKDWSGVMRRKGNDLKRKKNEQAVEMVGVLYSTSSR